MNPALKMLLVLLALLLPALLAGLGERPVDKIQEVRIAETAREMLVSGDWLVPRYNGELRLQKPPLPYWLTAASYRALGVSEFATRLPAVLFGLLCAWLIWRWLSREIGAGAAGNGVLVLVASYLGLRYFRTGEADAVLLFFVSAACLLGWDILQGRHDARRLLLFGLALGLGFLSKGPPGLAIPALALLAMAAIERRAGRLRPAPGQFLNLPAAALLVATAFGWYVWMAWRLPGVAQHFFGRQLDETFVSGSHAKPLWWYAAHWFEFFAPWSVLLIPAGWLALRRDGIALPPLIRFAWVWLAAVFVLLTATINKQTQYALLLAPPAALVIGHYLAEAQGGFVRVNRVLFGLFCIAAAAGIIVALRKSVDLPADLLWLALPAAPLIAQRLLRVPSLSAPVLLVAGVTAMAFLYSEAGSSRGPNKTAAMLLMRQAAGHAPLYQSAALNDGALSFYAGRVVPPVDAADIAQLLHGRSEIWLVAEEPPDLPDAALQMETQVGGLGLYRVRPGS